MGGGGKRDGVGRGVTSVSLSLCTDTDDHVTLGEDATSHAITDGTVGAVSSHQTKADPTFV